MLSIEPLKTLGLCSALSSITFERLSFALLGITSLERERERERFLFSP